MKTEADFGRTPVSVVEIVQPICALSYGVAPCTAAIGTTGQDRCYNTFKTCQDRVNYTVGTPVSLLFMKPQVKLLAGEYVIPSLISVSTAPSMINPSGVSKTSSPLGQRAVCNVALMDHPHSDLVVDPYRTSRAFDPYTRSTFWRKWLARNPYHEGYTLRVYDGYEGQSLAEMTRREYVIDKIDGPSNGAVNIVAKDPLKLADDDRAQAPRASTGVTFAAISAVASSVQIIDAANGDYPAPGTVRVGDECMTYTGSSYDAGTGLTTLTGLTRGTDGTTAEEHDEGETVQWCLRITNTPAWEVARDLLEDYAGIDPAFIPFAEWDAEALEYIPSFTVTTLITEPTGVNQLIGELSQQCLFFLWWDERASEIKFRAVRTYKSAQKTITDDQNILADSMSLSRKPEERISQVWIYYDRRSAAEKVDEPSNYRIRRVRADLDAETENEYGTARVRTIFSRWLESDVQAIALGARILNQYRDIPERIRVRLDAKDRELWTADIVDVRSRHLVDFYGNQQTKRYQIISADEVIPGETVEYDLISLRFFGRPAVYMQPGDPVYSAATDEEKESGGWYAYGGGTMSDGVPGYTYQ